MRSLALLISRFCLGVWVGAASFFVLVVINLRASSLFDSAVKLNHPRVLFPLFYRCEFALLTVALLAGLAAWGHPRFARGRQRSYLLHLGLVAVALLVALADYTWVYPPLFTMLSADPLPDNFRTYHEASRWLNTLVLGLSAAAALISYWPGSDAQQMTADAAQP